jgi:hypothetical protein
MPLQTCLTRYVTIPFAKLAHKYYDFFAVFMHDSNGTSKASSAGCTSGFSKASFVSARTSESSGSLQDSNQALSLDDPDFWTKVVGLAEINGDSDDDEHPGGHSHGKRKRRKCRNALMEGAYKEPGMSFMNVRLFFLFYFYFFK